MKKLFFGLLAIVFIITASSLYITRDIAATHTTLKHSDLAPLIPTRAFYADPRSAASYVPSNDGRFVSFTKASVLGRKIVVKNLETGEEFAEFPVDLQNIRWHPTKPLLRFIYRGHDWEADPWKPEPENWRRTSPVKLSGWWYKNEIAQDDQQKIKTLGKTRQNEVGHMWLVSQDGLVTEKIAEGNNTTQYWVFDGHKPILRMDSLDPSTLRVFRKVEDDWTVLTDIAHEDQFRPLFIRADGTMLAISARGRDKTALVSFDLETAQETVVLENPNTDIGGIIALTPSGEPDLIRLGNGSLERVALTERGQVFLDIINQFEQPISLGRTSITASGRYVAQALSSQNKSYIYLLIDLQEKSFVTLGEYHFRRFKEHLVQDKFMTFRARDGLEIPAILSRPKGVTGPIPFIVNIHGGPASHVVKGYSHEVQFLVNRGYGVLSVNFRGSTGFGKEFQAKGYNEFGRAMQDDIADAARWLIQEGMADKDALVAMGGSYGGYSAALAMTRDPDLFDAAIVEFPMLDVAYQSRYHPGFWERGINGWWRYFGKPDNPQDLALMNEYSPINLVNDLHGPILLIGGMRDDITAVQQAKDFAAAAQAAGKEVQEHYFADAGHGLNHWRDRLRHGRLVEDFLAEKIGGRSGGFEFVEWLPEFID